MSIFKNISSRNLKRNIRSRSCEAIEKAAELDRRYTDILKAAQSRACRIAYLSYQLTIELPTKANLEESRRLIDAALISSPESPETIEALKYKKNKMDEWIGCLHKLKESATLPGPSSSTPKSKLEVNNPDAYFEEAYNDDHVTRRLTFHPTHLNDPYADMPRTYPIDTSGESPEWYRSGTTTIKTFDINSQLNQNNTGTNNVTASPRLQPNNNNNNNLNTKATGNYKISFEKALSFLPEFDGTPNALPYFSQVARMLVEDYGPGNDRVILMALNTKLRGKAAAAYLPRLLQYASVERLLEDLSIQYGSIDSAETLQIEIKTIKQEVGESAADFGLRMQLLHNRLLNLYESSKDYTLEVREAYKAIFDREVREQYIFGLRGELQHQVRSERPITLRNAISIAARFEHSNQARRNILESPSTAFQACAAQNKCNYMTSEVNHNRMNLNDQCFAHTDISHPGDLTLSNSAHICRARANEACSYCGSVEHAVNDCRKKAYDSKFCDYCKIKGHTRGECRSLTDALASGEISKRRENTANYNNKRENNYNFNNKNYHYRGNNYNTRRLNNVTNQNYRSTNYNHRNYNRDHGYNDYGPTSYSNNRNPSRDRSNYPYEINASQNQTFEPLNYQDARRQGIAPSGTSSKQEENTSQKRSQSGLLHQQKDHQ